MKNATENTRAKSRLDRARRRLQKLIKEDKEIEKQWLRVKNSDNPEKSKQISQDWNKLRKRIEHTRESVNKASDDYVITLSKRERNSRFVKLLS